MEPPKDHRGKKSSPMVMAGAGLELGVSIAGLMLLGSWLDQKLDTDPWLMLSGLAMALIGGTYTVWRVSKRVFDNPGP